jgi:vacuolar-type H+-ATPase subunit I/STV1
VFRVTFHYDEEAGKLVERKVTVKKLATTAIDAVIDVAEANAKLIHILLEFTIKIGLAILLIPYLVGFINYFIKVAMNMPPMTAIPLN